MPAIACIPEFVAAALRAVRAPAAGGEFINTTFGDRESPLSNVSGVLGSLQEAGSGMTPDEQRMSLVGIGALLMLVFLVFAGLRSGR